MFLLISSIILFVVATIAIVVFYVWKETENVHEYTLTQLLNECMQEENGPKHCQFIAVNKKGKQSVHYESLPKNVDPKSFQGKTFKDHVTNHFYYFGYSNVYKLFYITYAICVVISALLIYIHFRKQ